MVFFNAIETGTYNLEKKINSLMSKIDDIIPVSIALVFLTKMYGIE